MQKAFLISLLAFLLSSCATTHGNKYVEGTSLTIGLYIPMNGTLYGIQFFNYLSGKKLSFDTNSVNKIKSHNSITNDLGIINNKTVIDCIKER